MQAGTAVRSLSRFATRQVILAIIVVVFAMAALAMLAEALNSGGGTVYLAEIQPSTGGGASVPSLAVVGYGSASAPAEYATIQFLFSNQENFYGGPINNSGSGDDSGATPEPVEEQASTPIVDAMVAAGAPEDGVSLVVSQSFTSSRYGPPDALWFRLDIVLPAPELEVVTAIVNAAGRAGAADGFRMVQSGVAYGVADCSPLRSAAWENAVADARARAVTQADLLGVEIGDLLVSNETAVGSAQAVVDASARNGSCAAGDETLANILAQGPSDLSVPAFDPTAPAETSAYAHVTLAFEIKD